MYLIKLLVVVVSIWYGFSERSDWLMSMNYFNLFFSWLELQTLPKIDCKFMRILNIFLLTLWRFFLKISEIYIMKYLLEDHFIYNNIKVYLLQYNDADFLCVCKKGVLKNLSKLTDVSGDIKMKHCLKWVKIALLHAYLGPYQTFMVKVFDKNS